MGPNHRVLQGALGSRGVLRVLSLKSGQNAGDVVLASIETLAQRGSNGQGGEREDDGATHIDCL